jgi:hypothetical protein
MDSLAALSEERIKPDAVAPASASAGLAATNSNDFSPNASFDRAKANAKKWPSRLSPCCFSRLASIKCYLLLTELKLLQLGGELVFSLIKDLGVRAAAKQEAVPFLVAFAIAEFFFKFKSFTLECLAFLAVWCVLSFFQSLVFPHKVRPTT